MNNDNLHKTLEANRRFYKQKFLPIYSKAYNPDEPRDWHGRWTGGSENDNTPQPAKSFSTSPKGVNFIATHESFSASVYPDQAGRPTIGYGHLIQPDEFFPNGITESHARQLLANDLTTAEQAVRNKVTVPLTQNQFDALTSLTYNIGSGPRGFGGSTVLHLLNQGDYNGAADHFADWNKVMLPNGQLAISSGLVNRRHAEQNLFLNGIY